MRGSVSKLLALVALAVFVPPLLAQKSTVDPTIKQVVTELKGLDLLPGVSEVTVSGGVVAPKRIRIKERLELTEAIAISGGLKCAAGRTVRIIRKDATGLYVREQSVDTRPILTGREKDFELLEGDIVIVPKEKKCFRNFPNLISGHLKVFYLTASARVILPTG